MADLPPDLTSEVRRTLADVRTVRLAATAWPAVAGDLGGLAAAVDRSDEAAVRSALVPVSQAAFEGKVRGRLAAADKPAAMVVATKQTSALPLVGAVCGGLLIVLGYLLGGWLVAAGTAVFALFIFGVALAGTRTNLDRTQARQARGLAPSAEPTEPAPRLVAELVTSIESALD
jgi:hypothetical protein